MGEAVVVVIAEFSVCGGAAGAIWGCFEMGFPFSFEMGGEWRGRRRELVVVRHWWREHDEKERTERTKRIGGGCEDGGEEGNYVE